MEDIFQEFGSDGFRDLVSRFYRRLLKDDLVGKMYPRDPDAFRMAQERLHGFLVARFLEDSDSRRLRPLGLRHSWMEIDEQKRDRWLELMNSAMDDVGLSGPARTRLEHYFTDTADALVNHEENHPFPIGSPPSFDDAPDQEL